MRILAIDASTKSSGWAIFDNNELKKYGLIAAADSDLVKRINTMITKLDKILQENDIEKIILEEVRPEEKGQQPNLKTHKALMYLQAAIVFLLHERYSNIELIYIYPSEWRSLCGIHTGRGIERQALKLADIQFVKEKFNIDNANDDMADAIGIGYGYLLSLNKKELSAW